MLGWLWRLLRGGREPPDLDGFDGDDGILRPDDDPTFPWTMIGTLPVGGLRSVGFGADSDFLLIVSEQGRMVVDGLSGTLVAHDPMRYLVGQERGEAAGIGPLKGELVRVAGPFGGDLPQATPDGWGLITEDMDEPDPAVLLMEPPRRLTSHGGEMVERLWRLAPAGRVVVAGISPTGLTIVLADREDVMIWGRSG